MGWHRPALELAGGGLVWAGHSPSAASLRLRCLVSQFATSIPMMNLLPRASERVGRMSGGVVRCLLSELQ
jgi:hypothetical protein